MNISVEKSMQILQGVIVPNNFIIISNYSYKKLFVKVLAKNCFS